MEPGSLLLAAQPGARRTELHGNAPLTSRSEGLATGIAICFGGIHNHSIHGPIGADDSTSSAPSRARPDDTRSRCGCTTCGTVHSVLYIREQ